MKVLITQALSGDAAKFRQKCDKEGKVVILGSADLPIFMLKNPLYVKIPPVTDTSFAHKILTVCLDYGINRIYVLNELEMKLLIEAEILFAEYEIEIVGKNSTNANFI